MISVFQQAVYARVRALEGFCRGLNYEPVSRARNRWLGVAVAGAGLGGGCFAGAWIARGEFYSDGYDVDQLTRLKSATVGLAVASGALSAVAVGGLVAVIVEGGR